MKNCFNLLFVLLLTFQLIAQDKTITIPWPDKKLEYEFSAINNSHIGLQFNKPNAVLMQGNLRKTLMVDTSLNIVVDKDFKVGERKQYFDLGLFSSRDAKKCYNLDIYGGGLGVTFSKKDEFIFTSVLGDGSGYSFSDLDSTQTRGIFINESGAGLISARDFWQDTTTKKGKIKKKKFNEYYIMIAKPGQEKLQKRKLDIDPVKLTETQWNFLAGFDKHIYMYRQEIFDSEGNLMTGYLRFNYKRINKIRLTIVKIDLNGEILKTTRFEKEFSKALFPMDQEYEDKIRDNFGTKEYHSSSKTNLSNKKGSSVTTYSPLHYAYSQVYMDSDENIYLCGVLSTNPKPQKAIGEYFYVSRIDLEGKELWSKEYRFSFQLKDQMKIFNSEQGLFKVSTFDGHLYVQMNRYPYIDTFRIDKKSGRKLKNWTFTMGKRNVIINGIKTGKWKDYKSPQVMLRLAMAKYAKASAFRRFTSLSKQKNLDFDIHFLDNKALLMTFEKDEEIKIELYK